MKKLVLSLLVISTFVFSCKKDCPVDPVDPVGIDLTGIPYSPTAYNLVIPVGLPSMDIPADNQLTEEGIALGRMLFYDPILSKDSTISCASCHQMEFSFNDDKAFSLGVNGLIGTRSSMSLMNIGFFNSGFFWDGRSATLEDQAIHPVENPLEMAEVWGNVEGKLKTHPDYPARFRKAFGIQNSSEITKGLAAKALAQFERTLISAGSRFDKKYQQGDTSNPFLISELEDEGHAIFFGITTTGINTLDAHCWHCHNGNSLLSSDQFQNNGIDSFPTLSDYKDKGLGEVTGKVVDNGKFKAPSLRNIALTAPYMHDGRFQTLEQVINHYNKGGHYADNVQPLSIEKLNMTQHQKDALLAFLHTLTDTTYYNNPAFKNPFN